MVSVDINLSLFQKLKKLSCQPCKAFLPPTNEVWGKIMFLHLFVCSMGEGCMPFLSGYLIPCSFWGWFKMSHLVWSHIPSGGALSGRGGASLVRRGASFRRGEEHGVSLQRDHPRYWQLVTDTKAGGTHPSGMHSCKSCVQGKQIVRNAQTV